MANYFVAFISAVIISFIMTPPARRLAIKVGAMDVPKDPRKIHGKPMPYFGGLAIYIAIMACMFVYMPHTKTNISIMAGATVLVLTGIVDDMYDMPARVKLVLQIVAAIIAIQGGVRIHFITNPLSDTGMSYLLGWLSYPITLFWLVGITNTINFIDGLDGLASGVASIAATTLLFTAAKLGHDFIVMQCAIIAGASLGFLPFNFNPAKIFMGDSGANFLGFILSIIALDGAFKQATILSLMLPILALAVPIFDNLFVIFKRFSEGKPVYQADRSQIHFRLQEKGLNITQIVTILSAISLVCSIISILLLMV